jgi:hypothetical protein
MYGLKKSNVKGNGYTLYDIPNQPNYKIAVHNEGDYVTVCGKCTNGWYRLGDRADLVPDCLKDFGLTCYRGSNKKEQKLFISNVLNKFI